MRKLIIGALALGLYHGTALAIDAPSDLTAVLDPVDNSVNLTWMNIQNATGYNIYRDDAYIDTVVSPTTTYTDTGPGSAYYVTAFDNSVEPTEFSSQSNTATVAEVSADCSALPTHAELTTALKASIALTGGPPNGGFDLHTWGAVVNRDGIVCAITHTGNTRSDQWPGSRVIAAQKANTANAFSLPGLSIASANLWSATQPGGSFFGLQSSNPVDPTVAYGTATDEPGTADNYGTPDDPMMGHFIGGINVAGGGLALYSEDGGILGAIGVGGDTSCADHNIAWRTRAELELDYVPGGVGPLPRTDNINYVGAAPNTNLQNDFSHPVCTIAGTDAVTTVSANLPETR